MKYIVFSDLHGNYDALEQMLEDTAAYKIAGYIYCGDIAGYYYDQDKIIDLFKNLKNIHAVKGNHDYYYVSIDDSTKRAVDYISLYGNSFNKKTDKKILDYLKKLPDSLCLNINSYKVGVFHGSPLNPMEDRIYPDTSNLTREFLKYDICFIGHTHYKLIKKFNDTIIINPGSLGQPRDGLGFSYCIFDFKTLDAEFKTVRFDKTELVKKIEYNEHDTRIKNYLISILFRGENNE